jgi:transcriptional regulator with XRE-family HTH domain
MELNSQRSLGTAVRAAREAQDMSQLELAKLSGVSRVTITKLELGKTNPTWESVLRVSEVLGLHLTASPGPAVPAAARRSLSPRRRAQGTAKVSAAVDDTLPADATDVEIVAPSLGSNREQRRTTSQLVPVDLDELLMRATGG